LGDVPFYAILCLLCLLLVDVFGGLLPVPEWALMVLAAALSGLVVFGLLGGGHHFYVLLFCLALLNVLAGFRSLPAWVDTVANVVWAAAIPAVILISVREWRSYRRENAG